MNRLDARHVGTWLLLAAWTSPALPQSAQRADPHFARGIELQNAGRLEEAIQEYEASLKNGPRLEVLGNLGAVYARLGRYEDAISRYEQALQLAPDQPMILFNLGLAHYKSGDMVKAISVFEKLRPGDPDNLRLQILLADCHFQLGAPTKTIEILAPLAQKRPDDLSIAYLLGNAYLADRQMDRGERQIEKILRHGESAEAHLMMAVALSGVYRNKQAIIEYEKALQLNPRLPMAHAGLATELLRQNQPERALAEYKAELEVNPNDYAANFYAGYLHRRNREYDIALQYLDRARRLRPGDSGALLQIAIVHSLTGHLDESQRILEGVIKNDTEFIDAYVQLARVYYRKRMVAEGRQAQKQADELRAKYEALKQAAGAPPGTDQLQRMPMEGTDIRP